MTLPPTPTLPLKRVAPAAPRRQVGRHAELAGSVLKAGCRNQRQCSEVRGGQGGQGHHWGRALTGQRHELKRGPAHDPGGVDLNPVVLVDRLLLRVFGREEETVTNCLLWFIYCPRSRFKGLTRGLRRKDSHESVRQSHFDRMFRGIDPLQRHRDLKTNRFDPS